MNLDELTSVTRDVAEPDSATLDRGRSAALGAVHQDLSGRARLVRRRVRRGVLTGVAAVATAAAIASVLSGPDAEKTPDLVAAPPPPVVEAHFENASQIVNAAATASGKSDAVLGDAPYWKVQSAWVQSGSEIPEENDGGTRTVWQGIDGPSVLTGSSFGDKAIRLPQATLQVGGRALTWPQVNADGLSRGQIRALLTDGEAGAGDKPGRAPHEWYFVKQAGELLSETPASPAIRRAIWKELATVAGAKTSGKVVDAEGREGWDLTYSVKGYGTQRFIVDPESGAILQGELEMRGMTYTTTYLAAEPAMTAPKPTPGGKS